MPKVKITKFVSQQSGSTCGRFSSDQLNVELIPPKPTKSWMKYAAIILRLVPTLGYSKEMIVPNQPIQEMPFPPITGGIEIETKGEIIAHNNPTTNEILIHGTITEYKSKKALTQARIINYQSSKLRKEIEVDKNRKFQASIPSNSSIHILSEGYQSKMLESLDLQTGKDIEITLTKIDFTPMGIIAVHPSKKTQKQYKGRMKLNSADTPKVMKVEEEVENTTLKITETKNQKVIEHENETTPIQNPSEEPMQYPLPTIEIVSYAESVVTGYMVGSYTNVNSEVKESWFMRLWKKFKSLIHESYEEALIRKALEEESENDSLVSASIDSNQHQTIDENMAESKSTHKENRNDQKSVEVNVYPNPSSGLFNIDVPSHIDIFFIEITDINNQLIISKDNTLFDGMIDLSNYASGSYIISIISEKQLISSKMIVKM